MRSDPPFCYVFGDFRVDPRKRVLARRDGTPLPLTPKQLDALLFMLANPGEDLDKDRLIGALWPGLVVEENNLSQAISGLRKALGDAEGQHRHIVTVPRRGYRFVASVSTEEIADGASVRQPLPSLAPGTLPDTLAMPASAQPAEPRRAAGLWRSNSLLWTVGVLLLLVVGVAWKRLPVAEPVLMPVQVAERASAPAPQAATLPARSIAVLPFANMSGDKGQEYFSDGISEELLNQLTKLRDLRVIARTSSFSFKGQSLEVSDIARRLNVDHVLQGSVRRSGRRVRITAQLVRAADSSQLWSETYDRDLTDIFALQDDIAAAVVAQLKAKLLGDLRQRKPVMPQAYALLLQAREAAHLRSDQGFNKAIGLLKQALALEPAYVEAWAELGAAYGAQAGNGLAPTVQGYAQAREATLKALAIDPGYAFVHAELAWIAMAFDHDLAAAARHLGRAVELAPDDDEVWRAAGPLAQALGRQEASIAIREARVARDPANLLTIADLAHGYRYAGRIDDSIARFRQVLAGDPTRPIQRASLAVALLKKGQSREALAQLQMLPEDSPARLVHSPIVWFGLRDKARADAALAALIRQRGEENAYHIAWCHAYRGEVDAAFAWLHKAAIYHDASLFRLAADPEFANLHADPRWLPLLRSLGMAPEQLAAIPFEMHLPAPVAK